MTSHFSIRTSPLRSAVSAALLMLVMQGSGGAQNIVYRGDPQPVGARGTALGRSLVSDIRDIEGLYDNPASLRALEFPGLSADHRHDWDQRVFFEALALRAFSTDFHSLGVGVRMTHAGTFGAKRELDFKQYSADVGYAIGVLPDLSFGIMAGGRMGMASGESVSGYSFSFGILYSPTPSIRYGLVVHDLGKCLEYTYDPLTLKTTVGLATFLPASIEMGSTLLFPSRSRAPYLQLSISVERDYILKELRYRGGMELTLWRFLAARVGYVNATYTQATAGLGLTVGSFRFDYAIMPRPQAPRYDEFSIKAFF